MILRRARDEEAETVANIFIAAWKAMDFVPHDLHTDEETRGYYRSIVFRDNAVVVTQESGAPTGFAAIGMRGEARGWLSQLYVHPDAQGRGLGTQLLARAKALSPLGLQLWTFQPNVGAIRFYTRHGFIEAERTDGQDNEENVPDVRMIWRV